MTMERYQGGMIAVEPAVMREVVAGNIAGLTAAQQTEYMLAVCNSLGLNPLVKPLEFIDFPARRGEPAKTVLYPNATAVNMLIDREALSVDYSDVHEDPERDIMIQWCYITNGKRQGKDFAALPISREEWQNQNGKNVRTGRKIPLDGEAWANQLMKLTTKARRRAVLAFCGLPSVFGGSESDARDADDAIVGEARIVDTTTGEVTAGDALPVLEATEAPATPPTAGEIEDLPKPKREPRAAKAAANTDEQVNAVPAGGEKPWEVLVAKAAADFSWDSQKCLTVLGHRTWPAAMSADPGKTTKDKLNGLWLRLLPIFDAESWQEPEPRPEAEKDLDTVGPPAGEEGHPNTPETPNTPEEVAAQVAETQDDLPF